MILNNDPPSGNKAEIACSTVMMITVTCCFDIKCWTLIGPFSVISQSEGVYKSEHRRSPAPVHSAVTLIKHDQPALGYSADLVFCGGG